MQKTLIAYDRRHGYRGVEANLGDPEQSSLVNWREELQGYSIMDGVRAAAIIDVKPNMLTALISNGKIITVAADKTAWANRRGSRDLTRWLKPGDVIRVLAVKGQGWDFRKYLKCKVQLLH